MVERKLFYARVPFVYPRHVKPAHELETKKMENLLDQGMPPGYLLTKDAAGFLGISLVALANMRRFGHGPKFYRVATVVVYLLSDLEVYKERGGVK